MLQIKNIFRQYKTGDLIQHALNGVSLNLRRNEFVSILGPSGSGKTTLLNIIGGLDRYDSGDLIINGTSTRDYRDRDWDTYRNHTIGFVFQSYNLIPHQSILANVELALTIAGISRKERRERARKALEAVGLAEQCHKRPNQLSGGQMQRVAIARALVNDPDILLADEPTGALDTETSLQIMELLRQVAQDRLVVMVTHNPELAEAYSTRIVKLRDGKIISDTNPYTPDGSQKQKPGKTGKAKMGFLTSLSLSFNNLLTKKGRTLLTAFAGSIGIIGIALILSLSTGVNTYISNIQKETMTSYPISITARTFDMSNMMGLRGQMIGLQQADPSTLNGVYGDTTQLEAAHLLSSNITENDLTAFKQYLDDPNSEIRQYLGENGVLYTYNIRFRVYARNSQGDLLDTDSSPENASDGGFASMMQNHPMMSGSNPMTSMSTLMSGSGAGAANFSELMRSQDSHSVSPVITNSYELLCGHWPEVYDQVILVLNGRNALELDVLFQLGLITKEDYDAIAAQVEETGSAQVPRFDYEDICGREFYLIPACDLYVRNEDGTFAYIGDDDTQAEQLAENGIRLTISGIIRPKEDAANASISTAIGYTAALTDYVIRHTDGSPVVQAQKADPQVNVLTGVGFAAPDDDTKIANTVAYIQAMDESGKASLYTMIQYYSALNREEAPAETTPQMPPEGMGGYPMAGGMQMNDSVMAAALDRWLAETPDWEILLSIYEEYLGGTSYDDNMDTFGKVSYDAPASISIYTDSFDAKEAVAQCISRYNDTVDEDSRITYVDYVQLITSSLTSIIDAISYVLIAFVAVSLVVSCIMIGIITHISVLERTKEIGILRALGASKRNISQVFNAETVIIGLCAGLLGVGITQALTVPINSLLESLLDNSSMQAELPVESAVILVMISVIVTVIGGLMPAGKAAKLDPVIALRTE